MVPNLMTGVENTNLGIKIDRATRAQISRYQREDSVPKESDDFLAMQQWTLKMQALGVKAFNMFDISMASGGKYVCVYLQPL